MRRSAYFCYNLQGDFAQAPSTIELDCVVFVQATVFEMKTEKNLYVLLRVFIIQSLW